MAVDREALLERYGRFYGEQRFAVAFTVANTATDPNDPLPKTVMSRGWQSTTPLSTGDQGAAIVTGRGSKKNPVVVLRPSRLVALECDTESDLTAIESLRLPVTITIRSSEPYRRHF